MQQLARTAFGEWSENRRRGYPDTIGNQKVFCGGFAITHCFFVVRRCDLMDEVVSIERRMARASVGEQQPKGNPELISATMQEKPKIAVAVKDNVRPVLANLPGSGEKCAPLFYDVDRKSTRLNSSHEWIS